MFADIEGGGSYWSEHSSKWDSVQKSNQNTKLSWDMELARSTIELQVSSEHTSIQPELVRAWNNQ